MVPLDVGTYFSLLLIPQHHYPAATEFSALSAKRSDAAEQSCTSDVTWPDEFKSNKTNECKYDNDELGLESDHNHAFSDR